jgi:probable rRNA maturation factor
MRLKLDVMGHDAFSGRRTLDFGAMALVLEGAFSAMGLGDRDELIIVLSFVPDDGIRALNARYRDIDEPTDVLTFPLWESFGKFSPPAGWTSLPLGDIVVSPDFVMRDAGEGDYGAALALVTIHGALHLVGFDHDTEDRRSAMWSRQDALLEKYLNDTGRSMSE